MSFVIIFTCKESHRLSKIIGLVFCRKCKLVLLYLGQPARVFTLEIDSCFQFLVRHYLRQNKQFYMIYKIYRITRCGSRIWSRGGPQLKRPKVADVAKRSRASEASNMRPGSRARLRALEAFGFLMLKYAFSHILETLFLSFLTSILTPKVDKNRALELTSINLRHSYILHLFFNLHEKVML